MLISENDRETYLAGGFCHGYKCYHTRIHMYLIVAYSESFCLQVTPDSNIVYPSSPDVTWNLTSAMYRAASRFVSHMELLV